MRFYPHYHHLEPDLDSALACLGSPLCLRVQSLSSVRMTSTPRVSQQQRFSIQTNASTSSASYAQPHDPSTAASYSFAPHSSNGVPTPFSSRRTTSSSLASSATSAHQTALVSSPSSGPNRYSNPPRTVSSASTRFAPVDEGNTSYSSSIHPSRVAVPDIVERPRDKTRQNEVSLSALSFLFSEIVSYTQNRVTGVTDLEKRLSLIGYTIGQRVLAMAMHRQEMSANAKNPKRETRLLPTLLWIHTGFWKAAFGKPADSLERSTEAGRGDECKLSPPPPSLVCMTMDILTRKMFALQT